MKKSDKDLNVPLDKRFGLNKPKPWENAPKKRYILRVYEEQEAQQEIVNFNDTKFNHEDSQLKRDESIHTKPS